MDCAVVLVVPGYDISWKKGVPVLFGVATCNVALCSVCDCRYSRYSFLNSTGLLNTKSVDLLVLNLILN